MCFVYDLKLLMLYTGPGKLTREVVVCMARVHGRHETPPEKQSTRAKHTSWTVGGVPLCLIRVARHRLKVKVKDSPNNRPTMTPFFFGVRPRAANQP